MSDLLPEEFQHIAPPTETDPPSEPTDLTPLPTDPEDPPAGPTDVIGVPQVIHPPQVDTPELFEYYTRPTQERIPHVGHLLLLALLAVSGLAIVAILAQVGIMYHVFGVSTLADAATNVRYLLGSQALLYVFTFAGSLIVFPLVWHKSFFAGLQWRGARALQRAGYLIGAAAFCFVLAMIDGYFFPGPNDAPIDRIFRMPGAAWILFAFGVTFAPFFEEIAFRGFLLPALATAFDWIAERFSPPRPCFSGLSIPPQRDRRSTLIATVILGLPFAAFSPRPAGHLLERAILLLVWAVAMAIWWLRVANKKPDHQPDQGFLDYNGHPLWPLPAMIVASVITSILFALMHADQTSYSLGPFLLLVLVSLVLCFARLRLRSLAASVLLHATYNFLLFSFMLIGTGGFRHLDKM